ncbi:MAG TPA: NAD(P)H-binding protein [Polyangiaceae bacterium]|nr:NAD(P)H-binding protein [Polyangiaceae bacterium]
MAEGNRTALLAGATGLVGRELLRQMAEASHYDRLHVLVRRPVKELSGLDKVQAHQVDFDALPALPAVDDVLIALGTTIKAAGSQEAFRRVDYDYVVDVARAARAAGAKRLGLVSALGADPKSRAFYNRVKSEAEQAVCELGYDSVVIAQPSLLIGDREALGQPVRRGELVARRVLGPLSKLIPLAVRPVEASAVASALLEHLRTTPKGVERIASRFMHPHPR